MKQYRRLKMAVACIFVFLIWALITRASPPTILIIGDSLTSGLYASSDETAFRNLVADDLGYDLTWCFGAKLPNVLNCWFANIDNYDVCVIENGLNDVSYPYWSDETYEREYRELIGHMKQYCGKVVVSTMFYATDTWYPTFDRYLRYNEYIKNSGGLVADVWEATRACTDCKSPIDYFHPNDKGHRMIADKIIWRIKARDYYFPVVVN